MFGTSFNRHSLSFSGLCLIALATLVTPRAHAATYNIPAGDVLALIIAIDDANAAPGYDKIVLAAGSTYNIHAAFGGDETGLPHIDSYIEITAPDGDTATVQRAGSGFFRLFQVTDGGTLRIDGITVRNGHAGSGGAIKNYGTLVIERSTISDSQASNTGAIRNEGDLSMVDTTVVGNSTTLSDTGALLNMGNCVMERCTFTDNWANRGAGAIGNLGYLRAVNTTLSGNSADVGGGAVINNPEGQLWFENVTVTNNTCDIDQSGGGDGGGIANSGYFSARNSLIAGNFDDSPNPADRKPDINGELFSRGYNLIGNAEGTNIVGDVMTNLVGYDDLFLGPLTDNGGWTDTHELLPGSPAIDNGNSDFPGSSMNSCDGEDQRGYARPADGDGNGVALCDIGAYERNGNPFVPPGGGKVAPPPEEDPRPWEKVATEEPEEPTEPQSPSQYLGR